MSDGADCSSRDRDRARPRSGSSDCAHAMPQSNVGTLKVLFKLYSIGEDGKNVDAGTAVRCFPPQ